MYIYTFIARRSSIISIPRKVIAACGGVTRKMLRERLRRWPSRELIFSQSERMAERANKEGIFSSHPTQQACQGCLLDVARRLDRCETFQCDICFSFVFHVIETPIVWSLPPRVVRVYAVGSFHPRFSLLRERKSRGHRNPIRS